MHITIVGIGSRGDVQPYIGLGEGLAAAGHDIRIAAQEEFRPVVESRGLSFSPIDYDPAVLLGSEEGVSWLESGRNPIAFMARLVEALGPLSLKVAEGVLAATDGTDAVIASVLGVSAYHVAEARGIPYIGAFLQPIHPTRAFPAFPLLRDLGPWGNVASARLGAVALELPFRRGLNAFRRDVLGLPPRRDVDFVGSLMRERVPVLYGFSPNLVPRPADWPPEARLCGYWTLRVRRDWEPDPKLAAFLEDGPPPVFVGFGSMRPRDPRRTSAIVVDALRRAGRRGIVAAGWAGLEADGEDLHVVGEVPHDWLFPRCAAVVHHGGAGTTATAVRAGVPSFAVPFFADQFFWAARTAREGVGPDPLPARRLEAGRLAAGIRVAVSDPGMRDRAAAAGARLAAEDGVAAAAAVLPRVLDGRAAGSGRSRLRAVGARAAGTATVGAARLRRPTARR